MPNDDDQAHTVSVLIEMGSHLERFVPPQGESTEFKEYLNVYLSELLFDFQLPLSAYIDIKTAEASLAPRELRVTVNGRRIWIGPDQEIQDATIALVLAPWIAGMLIAEPECLVNDKIAGNIAQDWLSAGVPWFKEHMPTSGFRDLLHALMRRGFRITRALEWARNRNPESDFSPDPFHVFEEIVEPVGSCSIEVLLTGSLYDEAFARLSAPELKAGVQDTSFDGLMGMLRDGLFYELGVYLPKVTLGQEMRFTGDIYRVRLNDRRLIPQPGLESGTAMVSATLQEIAVLGIDGSTTTNPANGNSAALVKDSEPVVSKLKANGYWVWDRLGHLVLTLSAEVRKRIGDFHTRGIATAGLELLAQGFPTLVSVARARLGDEMLTRVFRELVDEEVSIRDHRALLETLLAIRRTVEVDPRDPELLIDTRDACAVASAKTVADLEIGELVGHCRRSLNRYISYKYAKNGLVAAYTVHSNVEESLRNVRVQPISEAEYNALIRGIKRALEGLSPAEPNPVILSAFDVRSTLRKTIMSYYPHLAVLSRQELTRDVRVKILGEITGVDL
jgi:hypothetical protein